jgi:hypothetical protein
LKLSVAYRERHLQLVYKGRAIESVCIQEWHNLKLLSGVTEVLRAWTKAMGPTPVAEASKSETGEVRLRRDCSCRMGRRVM